MRGKLGAGLAGVGGMDGGAMLVAVGCVGGFCGLGALDSRFLFSVARTSHTSYSSSSWLSGTSSSVRSVTCAVWISDTASKLRDACGGWSRWKGAGGDACVGSAEDSGVVEEVLASQVSMPCFNPRLLPSLGMGWPLGR